MHPFPPGAPRDPHPDPNEPVEARPYGSRTGTRIRTEESPPDHVASVVTWIGSVLKGRPTGGDAVPSTRT
eukprot:scaffold426_cov319-Pavlova_lutheri.AAC.1